MSRREQTRAGLSMLLGGAQQADRAAPVQRSTSKQNDRASAVPSGTPGHGEIELSLIGPDPDQPRKHFDETALQELAESIQEVGVLQAITVRRHPKSGERYIVIAGERRYRAAKLAGLTSIPAVVSSPASHKLKLREIQMIENIHREALTPMEIADYMRQKITDGMKKGDIAALIKKSPAFVSRHLALVNMPKFLQELFDSGRCTDVSVIYELRLLHKDAPEKVAAWLRGTKQELTRRAVTDLRKLIHEGMEPVGSEPIAVQPNKAKSDDQQPSKQFDTTRSEQLSQLLGTRVQVENSHIRINYLNPEELERIEGIMRAGAEQGRVAAD